VNPQLSALEVKAVLEQTADKIADPEPQGMLSLAQGVYDTAGHSAWFGYGKVNAALRGRACGQCYAAQRRVRWTKKLM
jgi:hypothetical protein